VFDAIVSGGANSGNRQVRLCAIVSMRNNKAEARVTRTSSVSEMSWSWTKDTAGPLRTGRLGIVKCRAAVCRVWSLSQILALSRNDVQTLCAERATPGAAANEHVNSGSSDDLTAQT
jgi:hypothetical protein